MMTTMKKSLVGVETFAGHRSASISEAYGQVLPIRGILNVRHSQEAQWTIIGQQWSGQTTFTLLLPKDKANGRVKVE